MEEWMNNSVQKIIAILTSGGDAPGMNYAIVSAARYAAKRGIKLVGITNGFAGIIDNQAKGLSYEENLAQNMVEIDIHTALDMEAMRGTWLRTARCKEFLNEDVRKKAYENLTKAGITGLIVVGGDGSFQGASKLADLGMPCIGIPATIDNDLFYTDYTLGFNTAVGVCVNAVHSVRATCRGHRRYHVVETMGRRCGKIATMTAMATGAEILIIPEKYWRIEEIAERILELKKSGNNRGTIVIAENSWENSNLMDYAKPAEEQQGKFDWIAYLNEKYQASGHRLIPEGEEFDSHRLAQLLEAMTGVETRHTVVGYTQRGESCSALDGYNAFRFGARAVKLLINADGEKTVRRALGVRNDEVFDVDLGEAVRRGKSIADSDMYELVNSL